MIDIHCHILPRLDDGPAKMEETLEMCRLACDGGVSAIIATPHMFNGMFYTNRKLILEAYAMAKEALASEGIPVKLYVGADLHLVSELRDKLRDKEAVTLNHGRYFLLELPSRVLPPNLNEVVEDLVSDDLVPIITHPERNEAILQREEILLDMLRRGALCQITAMSVTGAFGQSCERFSRALIKAGAVHFIASDAHSTRWRGPGLSEAVKVAEELVGEEGARRLVHDNPAAVLESRPIDHPDVQALPRRNRFWFF